MGASRNVGLAKSPQGFVSRIKSVSCVWWFVLLVLLYVFQVKFWLKPDKKSESEWDVSELTKPENRLSQPFDHDEPLLNTNEVGFGGKNSEESNSDPKFDKDKISFHCQVIQRSHLHSKECGNVASSKSTRRPILITGTGRSGTDFVHTLFTKLGLKLSHDVRGPAPDGGVSWPEAFNEKKCKHPHWNWKMPIGGGWTNRGKYYTFDHVFHLVRHPLKQMLSRANNGEWVSSENRRVTACNTVADEGVNRTETRLNRALSLTLRHWVLYNSFIEQYAEWRFRLEQLNEDKDYVVKEIFTRSGFDLPSDQKTEDSQVSTHKNSDHTKKPKGLTLTWKNLYEKDPKYAEMCQAMALKYGYEVDEEEIYPSVRQKCDVRTVVTSTVDCWFRDKDRKWECVLSQKECP